LAIEVNNFSVFTIFIATFLCTGIIVDEDQVVEENNSKKKKKK
jgi:hypothetical protein